MEGQVAITAWNERMEMGAAKISIYSEGGNERARAEGGFDATLSSTRDRGRPNPIPNRKHFAISQLRTLDEFRERIHGGKLHLA